MYSCHVFRKVSSSTNFKLMAGPDANSVIVVKFTNNLRSYKNIPYELIENISQKHITTQARLSQDDYF